jgi:hypothetical protein
MLLWVNLHGGFVVGFALLAVYIIGAGIEYITRPEQRHETRQRLKRLGLVSLLSLLASFVNPYGYNLHLHIYHYLSDKFLMNQVSEFRSPDFHGAAQQLFAVLLLITIVAVASARQQQPPARLLVTLLAAYSGLYASRNLPVSSILLTLIAAPILSTTFAAGASNQEIARWLHSALSRLQDFGTRMGRLEHDFRGHVWPMIVLVLGIAVCMNAGRLQSTQLLNADFDDKRFPVEAAEVIIRRDIREPIFCPDQWGGYLIYKLYPRTKVLVDDRHDLYGDQFFKDYLKVIYLQPDWSKILDKRHVDWILVQKDSSLGTMLELTSGWKLIHADQTAVLFHREKV